MDIQKELQKIDSIVFGNYILKYYGPMSHLKLQKLLFYCDAYHLAYFDTELVSDKFEAWVHGPVSTKVFDSFKDKSVLYSDLYFPNSSVDGDPDLEFDKLTTSQKDFLKEVLSNLAKWNDLELEASSHNETPWKDARKGFSPGDICKKEISKETTKQYYKQELNG